ncbi:MAG: hypothetical protein IJ545_00525 [Alphaproteobacteria bacterium]|nr:hypothetical protein [Alphaproteobacteria bacterium]
MTKKHLNNEIIYQIYPLTFAYASGSKTDLYPSGAYGNLKGITSRVKYVKDLGVDTIWITPFYKWGGHGFGYDITDYRSIDPIYGDIDDFKELCEVYHHYGIRVLIDQVYNHCSIYHPWFAESEDKKLGFEDFFVWADAKGFDEKGKPLVPNNWTSIWDSSGNSAWMWSDTRKQFYLHSFDWSMPNLNLNNREVQNAILDVSKFWFDLGVDGFRLDAVGHYACDPLLRDNAFDEKGNPIHRYDINSQGGAEFVNRLKQLCNAYPVPKTLLAEYGYDKSRQGIENTKKILAESRCDAFFTFALKLNGGLKTLGTTLQNEMRISPNGEKLNWAFSNHDLERAPSRLFGNQYSVRKSKLLMALLMTLPGSICIFQGEELGLPNPKTMAECKNPANDPLDIWTDYDSPWDASRAGFAMSDSLQDPSRKLALHPSEDQYKYAVSRQKWDSDSMLNYTKDWIRFRKESPFFRRYGNIIPLRVKKANVIAFVRTDADDNSRCLCIFNFNKYPVEVKYKGKRHIVRGEDYILD